LAEKGIFLRGRARPHDGWAHTEGTGLSMLGADLMEKSKKTEKKSKELHWTLKATDKHGVSFRFLEDPARL
jgi:hypothetical protein